MELLVEVPGEWWFTPQAFNDQGHLVNYKAIEVNDEVKHYMKIIVECMEEAQTYTFTKIAPEIGILGKAEAKAAPFWLH